MEDKTPATRIYRRRWWFVTAAVVIVIIILSFLGHSKPKAVTSFADCARLGYPVATSYPETCSDGHHTFVGPTDTPLPRGVLSVSIPFEILVDGDSHGKYPNKQEVFTTQAGFARYWSAVHASITPLPPIIPVDFSKDVVAAVSDGQQSTGGYTLVITSVTTTGATTSVEVRSTVPGPGCIVTASLTNPYYIVRFPRPAGAVTFHTTTEPSSCSR